MSNIGRKQTVMIVDDNDDVRDVLRTQLRMLGYRVLEAADGQEAIELIGSEVPNLILMDLNMPGVDGFTATRLIRRNTKNSALVIIALTALSGLKIRQKALEAGCDDYVVKPIPMTDLALLLAHHRVPNRNEIS